MTEKRIFRFPDVEQVPAESPDASHLASRFDADPGISAEIAVERGEATPEEEDFVEQLRAEQPLEVETGDTIEAEVPFDPEQTKPQAVAYFPDQAAALLANEDGATFTQRETATPNPTRQENPSND